VCVCARVCVVPTSRSQHKMINGSCIFRTTFSGATCTIPSLPYVILQRSHVYGRYNPLPTDALGVVQIFRKNPVDISVVAHTGRVYRHPGHLSNSGSLEGLRVSRYLPSGYSRVIIDSTDEFGKTWAAVGPSIDILAARERI
jgi:hypothetical protein